MRIRTALAGLTIALPGVLILNAGTADAAVAPVAEIAPVWMTTPCEFEDSVDCYWDASTAGNGEGMSFWSVVVGSEVCRYYWGAENVKYDVCLDNPYA